MSATVDQISNKVFDYIITAGLVVAARLSEDPAMTVLVLEAGPANIDDPAIPTFANPSMIGDTRLSVLFVCNSGPELSVSTYEPQIPQDRLGGRSLYWARGKGLGGSSAINFFQFHLPAKSDIDAFEELGNVGWNWELLKKYYRKVEQFVPPTQPGPEVASFDLAEHGVDGPLTTAFPITISNFEKPYQEALGAFGIQRVDEPFSGNVGSDLFIMYYKPNASRPNLTVLTSAHVVGIATSKVSNTDDPSLTATAVTFVHQGSTYNAMVGKEVILAAGAIMSPQILELSGIGDQEVLRNADIDVKLHLPGVGTNVQEHVHSGVTYEVRKEIEDDYLTFDCLRDPEEMKKQLKLYESGKGVYGMATTCMTFVPLSSISPDAEALQQRKLEADITARIKSGEYSPALEKQLTVQLEHIKAQEPTCELVLANRFSTFPKLPEPKEKYVTFTCLLNHPISRGTIHVASNDPLQQPKIDPHYCEEAYDILSLIEMLKFSRRLAQQEPLKSLLTGVEINPGFEYETDEQIADYLKANFNTTYHTIGSCSMLPHEDGGVVDNKLKVYGTTNLRVADISIIPLHIGAHTQATAYAIAELAADIIKGKVLSSS
ncbi:alcohol oxidase [Amylostereum chailletii]|nr:alcohol oxidase [Amylostereum chailletii]